MGKKQEYRRNAIDWQLIGHQTKTERNNLFLTFVVATIGFAASIIWTFDNFIILKHYFATPIYFLSVILLFISFYIFFSLSNELKGIAFKYSEIQGSLAFDRRLENDATIWDELNLMHDKYYTKFDYGFYIYIVALSLLIISILITVYCK